jgi:hypothetical protein
MHWRPRSIDDVLARIARGDGQGEGPGFVPWLDMNFSSKGRTRAFTGPIREGIGITVADLEHMATVLVEHARGTVDVRHQVALLPLEEPQDIAREMGVKPPMYPGTCIPFVMTSDVVRTREIHGHKRFYVFSLKRDDDINLNTKDEKKLKEICRTRELLEIERVYWRARHAFWCLLTELTIPVTRYRSLCLFRNATLRRDRDHLDSYIVPFTRLVIATWLEHRSYPLNYFLEVGAEKFHLSIDESFDLCGRAIWSRMLPIDLDTEALHHMLPIRLRIRGVNRYQGK